MTLQELDTANKLEQKIKRYQKAIDDLNILKQMVTGNPTTEVNIAIGTKSVLIPSGIAMATIDAVITKYTNLMNKAQTDFTNL